MRKRISILIFLFLCSLSLYSQVLSGIEYVSAKKVTLPFEYQNNLIFIDVTFNQIFPLRFIFDTGAEHTILTRREITDILEINYRRKFTLYGADLSTQLTAYLAQGINLELGNLQLFNRNILVLEEDYFNFDEFSGIDIHGILGADIFRRFVVEINYNRRVINFYPRENFEIPKKRFKNYPLEIHRSRPYINVPVLSANDSILNAKLLLDTGSSLPMILYPETSPFLEIPENVVPGQLGIGLGGFLEGVVGRVAQVDIGGTILPDVLASFQNVGIVVDSSALNNRNGTLGNQTLHHFHIIIDYVKQKLYIAPAKKKPPKFKFDKSGLFLVAGGNNLNQFQVASVVPDSPAERAGLKVKDKLLRINGTPSVFLSLGNLQRKLKRREGKRITMVYEREGKRYKTSFELEKLL